MGAPTSAWRTGPIWCSPKAPCSITVAYAICPTSGLPTSPRQPISWPVGSRNARWPRSTHRRRERKTEGKEQGQEQGHMHELLKRSLDRTSNVHDATTGLSEADL